MPERSAPHVGRPDREGRLHPEADARQHLRGARNGGVAIRLDGDPPDCAVSLHTAIKAPFNIVKIGGVTASECAVHGHEGQPLLGTA